ncbi:MAG: hypothetical protein AAFP78_12835, partial [Pseudomonadota bacterium]
NDYIVATGASAYSAFANLAAAAVAFAAALLVYRLVSFEAAVAVFSAGGLALSLILQANPNHARTFGRWRAFSITIGGAILAAAALTFAYRDFFVTTAG